MKGYRLSQLRDHTTEVRKWFNQALNNPALDIWDWGDLIMYHYWYNIGLLQEIYRDFTESKYSGLLWDLKSQ